MALNLLNHNHNKTNTNKLLSKDSRLKKIISVINYLNKSFEKNMIFQYIEFILILKN